MQFVIVKKKNLIRHWHKWENHRKHYKSNRVRTVTRCFVAIEKTGFTSFRCQLLPVLCRYSYHSAQWSSPCLLFKCYLPWPWYLQRCRNVLTQRHHKWTLQANFYLKLLAICPHFSLLYIFTFLFFFASLSSTMQPPLPRSKIILRSPFFAQAI